MRFRETLRITQNHGCKTILLRLFQADFNKYLMCSQRQGSWRSLVERVKAAQKRGALVTPDEEMTYGTYHLFALMKLQNYRAAADELAAFGDLDSPQYRYENHSSLYPGKSGS